MIIFLLQILIFVSARAAADSLSRYKPQVRDDQS